ncbi:uncharacterized protein LOC107788391 isoform X1 [Nicotiana tabacum]|uniref:Two-component response regulator ORR24 isoform X1 n=2 Tax=Nicotiana tabacum TaxID=4097 RepID=A0A1S3ZMG4_TOBAC|nr:PREDICTED: two-component response regulator ORR24-like isoform X1 [Nicotiana tabacum]XP_016465558.1 PREDICTED: two-component response regulator ORR24-like isoform X1 [Nicotiana tabacum]
MEGLLALAWKFGLQCLLHIQKSRGSSGRRRHTVNLCQSMEVETLINKSISILVVDDDVVCLSIVAMILKKCKYQVMTVKHPMDALSILRIKGGSFDLVVVDVHMPDMNGFELQQVITDEFELPVVLMSADDKEGTILKGLDGGAAFFLKPISVDDLRDLWQYTLLQKKKGKRVVLEEIDCLEKSSNCNKKSLHEVGESASSINENYYQHIKKEKSKRKPARTQRNADKDNSGNSAALFKKAKVVWTSSLHNKFLEAIRDIGFDKAVPKKILDQMKVPGLTRENVASHLQKYRIFLERVSDACCRIQAADTNLAIKAVQSTFASGMLSQEKIGLQKQFSENTTNPRSLIHTANNGSSSFRTQQTRQAIPLGYEQAQLFLNEGILGNITHSNEIPLYKANQLTSTMKANNYQTGTSAYEDISSQLMNGTTSTQVRRMLSRVPANRLSDRNLLALGTNGITKHATLNGNLNFLHDGFADDQCGTNFTQNNDADEASTLFAGLMNFIGKSQHDSEQCLAQEASSSVGFDGEKQCSAILSDHIDEDTSMQLPSFVNDVCRGQEVDATLNPVCNFSEFHNINATQQSRGIGDLSVPFVNQGNVQPHQQSGEDYLQWFGQIPFKQQEHIGHSEPAEDGMSQLHNVFSYPTEQCKNEQFLELVLASSPYEGDQNPDGL